MVNYLLFVFHETRLVILLQDVLKEKKKMRERKESKKEEEMTKITRKTRMEKVRNLVIFLKKKLILNLKVMMMKLSMFL